MNENMDIQTRIAALEEQIASLPPGSVSTKKVNEKIYYYHRFSENKKRREKYIPADEVETLKAQIGQRKELEAELKKLRRQFPAVRKQEPAPAHVFQTNVRTGEALRLLFNPVKKYKERECIAALRDYIYGDIQDRVFLLYGLRRTGKTTMIRQILAGMNDADLEKTAFFQLTEGDRFSDINRDLKYLEENHYRYLFLDEVTLVSDFIENAALFSDIYAACGMKVVLSGTDSLGFLFAEDEELYDRCVLLRTTFIPYREFETVLGIRGIDEYIRYGGTMSLSGTQYNARSPFSSGQKADEYVDTAIARNIQHSLAGYHHGSHFRQLKDLYIRNELTSAINRVVEDINHEFTLEVLTRDFYSHDLGVSANNLRRDQEQPIELADHIDMAAVTERLRQLLEIRNEGEQSVKIEEAHRLQIREYLILLDLIHEIDIVSLPYVNAREKRTIISQPGLRYAQAGALVQSLMEDEQFNELSARERSYVMERILNEIRGRMMEDIVLLETTLAYPGKEVAVVKFSVGEFDMLVADPETLSCEIYEIKHSTEIVPQQTRHLLDETKCAQAEHRYGTITGKYVLYRGETETVGEVQYVNVEEYLKGLGIGEENYFQ